MFKIILAETWGFCFGVERALRIVEKTAEKSEGPVKILNKIVHNASIVNKLEERNISSIKDLSEIHEGTLVISAHGVAPKVKNQAQKKGLNIVDTTCPLVTRIHKATQQFLDKGYTVILYGDESHNEVKGVVGLAPDRIIVVNGPEEIENLPVIDEPLALVSQSTQSLEGFDLMEQKLKEKYPNLEVENTICEPTVKRQEAIAKLAPQVDMLIVVGSTISSNSLRLLELARKFCPKSYLIDAVDQIQKEWLENVETVGITAGASTPAYLVKAIIEKLYQIYEEHYLPKTVTQ
ncbi:MAG: 4-hydroxy-3-methylbut-2-enyl diphosphate reductase [candidate division Zixibacteria bacterium RBG_16_40_9]|nr:MAG: 4-hydroxy-3-methylbut-2-enyl diphosphate reductase [candidate division Zixibacteria bacterium RBG_16_40_9]